MPTPVTIDLDNHTLGDRWPGIPVIGPVVVTGTSTPPGGDLTRVRMHLRHSSGAVYRLDSDSSAQRDAPIVIDDPATWEAHVPEVESFVPQAGRWEWDMEFHHADAAGPLTLYKGTINVAADITR